MRLERLSVPGCDLLVDVSAGVPVLVHWGAPLGDAPLTHLAAAVARPVPGGSIEEPPALSVVPEHGSGHPGRPGLLGHRRRGTAWAPRFQPSSVTRADGSLTVVAVDPVAELELTTELRLADVLEVRCTVRNLSESRYLLQGLGVTLPLPAHAAELLTLHGRWTREFHTERRPFTTGTWLAENRLGRTSHERPPLVFAGQPGFGEWSGEVWGAHLAWSGNHFVAAELLPDGRRSLQLGELLHPGEIALEPGQTYSTPTVLGVYSGTGLTAASQQFHRFARSLPAHPSRPRPVLLNTWEAVYFDHNTERLKALATAAAEVGIERFVLDDGWFGSRRGSTAGLGDWEVSPEVYPDGLGPLIAHVRSLGLEFGLWVEPEMVNPDSDVYRAHPDWALVTEGYEPKLGRHQLVLDLTNPAAYAHVRDQLHAVLSQNDIAYIKWDHNRVLVQGSDATGASGAHRQTLAAYALFDELRGLHPSVEFESCSGGGGRIDLEILRRTERVWTSDCNDALERQTIQRGASLLIPPEVMGAHIGPTRAHTTGRSQSLPFRAITAIWGHLGVEWNLLELSPEEREALAAAIAVHRRFRPLLHGGQVVRFDPVLNGTHASAHAHGVYADDLSEALVAAVQLTTGMSLVPAPLRLPGLLPDAIYRVQEISLGGKRPPLEPLVLSGRQLATIGIQLPVLAPETGVLLHLAVQT
jgi:alpha-galactosidase